MRLILLITALIGAVALSGCGPQVKPYDGPEVTRIVVMKSQRQMYLMHEDAVLASHEIDLGFAPDGHKTRYGDGRTPEGRYFIDRRNPNSAFYLSLGISYPNAEDRAKAAELGEDPGGDIFIHGGPTDRKLRKKPDWTAGCISVPDKEMARIYPMIRVGTPIDIYP